MGDIEVDGFDDGTPEEEGDTLGGGVSSMQCKKPTTSMHRMIKNMVIYTFNTLLKCPDRLRIRELM